MPHSKRLLLRRKVVDHMAKEADWAVDTDPPEGKMPVETDEDEDE